MNLLDVLNVIRLAGGTVQIDVGEVFVEVPTGTLTLDHRAVLVAHKSEIIRLFGNDTRSSTGTPVHGTVAADISQTPIKTEPVVAVDRQSIDRQQRPPGDAPAVWREIVRNDRQEVPLVRVMMKVDTEWCNPGGDRFIIPARAFGCLVVDPIRQIPNDTDRHTIADTLKRKYRSGSPAVAVEIWGKSRVIDRSLVHF